MTPRPARQRPGGPSLVPNVQNIAVGSPAADAATGEALRVPLAAVAPNPLNRRQVDSHSAAVISLARSLLEYGQMKACTVVTRAAFVAVFEELADQVEGADYVHVDGALRRAGAEQAGIGHLAVTVDDSYVSSRRRFIGATVTENLDRTDFNPMEEADQIAVLVAEVGTQAAAADQMHRTGAWVTQRLNLLKLEPEVREAVRTGELPVKEVRELHRADRAQQLSALARFRALVASRERREEQSGQVAAPRPSRVSAPYRRLDAETRLKVAAALREELAIGDRRALAIEYRALADDIESDE